MRTSWVRTRNQGFSLVELLTVIAIVVLIISIILPALSGARNAGRKLATAGLLDDISKASSSFKGDHQGRNPGYFSPKEMGDAENATRGMSEMENVMLELAGEDAILDAATASSVEVGPTAADTIMVDPSLIGAGKGSYFTPSGEYYIAQLRGSEQQIADQDGHAGDDESDVQMRDVVDAFGQPVLFWSADDYSMSEITESDAFMRRQSGGEPALFYWNSNAAFLQSTNLGKKGLDMTVAPDAGVNASLIGLGAVGTGTTLGGESALSLQALLGSPSAPRSGNSAMTVEDIFDSPSESSIESLYPGRAKGAFILQSAGIDGVYLSTKDKGFSTIAHETDHIDYGLNFFAGASERITDDDGKPTSRDAVSEFDDLITSGGG